MNCMADNIRLKALESWFFGAVETTHYCFQSERPPSNSASTPAHRPIFVNSFVMSDCSKSRRARGNKICQSLLKSPPWNCKGNEERLKLESNVCLWKLIYTHIALEPVRDSCGYLGVVTAISWTHCFSFFFFATDVIISYKQGFISHFIRKFRYTLNLFFRHYI